MNNINKIILCILILFTSGAKPIEQDKVKHITASAVIGGVAQHAFNDYRYSSLACLSAGLAKELTDTAIDSKDLLADAVGCAIGIFTYSATDYMLNIAPIHNGAEIQVNFKF